MNEAIDKLNDIRPPTDLLSPMFFNIRISGINGEELIEYADLKTLEGFITAYQKYSDEGYEMTLDWDYIYLQ